MALIVFDKDLQLEATVNDLYKTKVSLDAFNSTINNIQVTISNLKSTVDEKYNELVKYVDTNIEDLVNTRIVPIEEAISTLQGDESVDGSVRSIVKEYIDALINGAGEAFDTLKEIVDYINSEAADLKEFINQVKNNVTTLIDNASEGWRTLGQIEKTVTAMFNDVNTTLETIQSEIKDLQASLPIYYVDADLPIDENNKITLTFKPSGDVFNNKADIYLLTEDENGIPLMNIKYMATVVKDVDDTTGKVYKIDIDPAKLPLNPFKAQVAYLYRPIDQE